MDLKGRRNRLLGGALCGVAVLAASPEAEFLDRLYTKFVTAYTRTQAPGAGNEILLLSHPGLPLTKEQLEDPYELSLLLDQIPQPSRFFHPSGLLASATYGDILRFSEASAFQNMADRKAALEAKRRLYDRAKPGKPTQVYAEYRKYQWEYQSAADAKAIALTNALAEGKPLPPGVGKRADEAMERWLKLGHKAEVEKDFEALEKFYGGNANAWFQALKDDFNLAKIQDHHSSAWYPVQADPPFEGWLEETGWNAFKYDSAERALPAVAAAPGVAAKDVKPAAASRPSGLASLAMTVETKRVRLTRPWLATNLFKSRNWRLLASSSIRTVATGNLADKDPGAFPLLITGVLLARNLAMKGVLKDPAADAAGLASLPALSLASPAPAGSPASPPKVTVHGAELTITSPAPQILGFFCEVLPKSPNPDAKFR